LDLRHLHLFPTRRSSDLSSSFGDGTLLETPLVSPSFCDVLFPSRSLAFGEGVNILPFLELPFLFCLSVESMPVSLFLFSLLFGLSFLFLFLFSFSYFFFFFFFFLFFLSCFLLFSAFNDGVDFYLVDFLFPFPPFFPSCFSPCLLLFCGVFGFGVGVIPLVKFDAIFAPPQPTASIPTPDFNPASTPNNFSTIFGPSMTATEKAIKAIKYAMPLKLSEIHPVPII